MSNFQLAILLTIFSIPRSGAPYLDKLFNMADQYFVDNRVLVFSTKEPLKKSSRLLTTQRIEEDLIVKSLMERQTWSFLQMDEKQRIVREVEEGKGEKFAYILVLLENHRVLNKLMVIMKQSRVFNHRSAVLVLCLHDCKPGDILKYFWDTIRTVNVTVLDEQGGLYTWFPYSQSKNMVTLTKSSNIFPHKIPKNFNHYPIRAATQPTVPYVIEPGKTGSEIVMMNIMAAKCNMSVQYIGLPEGGNPRNVFTADGRYTGFFKMLNQLEVDIAFAGMQVNNRFQGGECLYRHTEDLLIWTYPKRRTIISWRSLIKPFQSETWTFIGSIIILNSVIISAFANFYKDRLLLRSIWFSLLSMWGVTLDLSLTKPPNSTPLRIFVFLCLYYALIVSCSYKSCLVTFLTKPSLEPSIKSAIDAVEVNGLDVRMHASSQRGVKGLPFFERLLKPGRHFFSQDAFENTYQVAINRTCISMAVFTENEYIVRQHFLDDSGEPLVEYFKERHSTFYTTMFMSHGHPLEQLFNDMTMHLVEGGVVDRILDDIMFQVKLASIFAGKGKQSSGLDKALKVSQLTIVFYGVMMSLSAAIILFLAEIVHYNYKKKTRTTK